LQQSRATGKSLKATIEFAKALLENNKLESLSLRGEAETCMGTDIIPVIKALSQNDTLLSLNISGHKAGDQAAQVIGL